MFYGTTTFTDTGNPVANWTFSYNETTGMVTMTKSTLYANLDGPGSVPDLQVTPISGLNLNTVFNNLLNG